MIKTLDINLYKPDIDNWKKSLEYAKSLPSNDEKIIFHCFWRVPKNFERKQLAVLKSIIVNNKNFEINLWSNVDLSDNIFFKEVSKFVTLRKWDFIEEAKGTQIENKVSLESIYDDTCYLEGDIFRILILHKYGGFYIDMDVLVLRDMSPLNNFEFLYQWGTSGFSPQEPNITMNGAVMRLNAKSDLSFEFIENLYNTKPNKNTTSWGNGLYSKIQRNELLVLPCMWFNSDWGFDGTTHSPFKNIGTPELFDGAFTYHWHNKWDDDISDGSKFQILEELNNEKFKLL